MLWTINHLSANCGQIGVDTCCCSFVTNICKPAFKMTPCVNVLSITCNFLGLLGEAMEAILCCREMDLELVVLNYAYAECLCKMPMCNVTFIGKHKYYQTTQAQNPLDYLFPLCNFGLKRAYLISQ